MNRFRIKVCGITRVQDAKIVGQLGFDMIGMIFYRPSPRYVNRATAKRIVKALSPTMLRVGVFVNEAVDVVIRTGRDVGLDIIQLHGDESTRDIRTLQAEGFRVAKAFTVDQKKDYDRIYKSPADIVLLDNRTDKLRGGTGETFDWTVKPPRKLSNLMLSGGISDKNVGEGVRIFDPTIVDVNSSVESRPGIKSRPKLKRFIKECDILRYGI